MNYTHDKNQVVFLKDADIISAFNEKNALDEIVLSNGIPSYDLFKKTYDELSTYDNNICVYLKENVNVSVDNLSTLLNNTILSVNGISVQHDLLSAALSSEIEKLSTALSNTVKLSVEQLCSEIASNDVDIANISAYLSDDVVHYKGDVSLADNYYDPEGNAILDTDKVLFGLLITNPLINKNRNYKILKGFAYKATTEKFQKYFDITAADGKLTLTNNSYLIAINDIEKVEDAKVSDFTVVYDSFADNYFLSNEVDRISAELSNELKNCELSVNGISVEVDRISAELSNELKNCELSVNGISVEVNRISAELSAELCCCELSVNGISTYVDKLELSVNGISIIVDNYKNGLSNSVDGLSVELNETSSYLNTQVQNIWEDIKGGINYKGHVEAFLNKVDHITPYPLCVLFANFYNTHDKTKDKIGSFDIHGNFNWISSISLNNGWMYCIDVKEPTIEESKTYVTTDNISVSNRDYLIVHSHNDALSCIELSDICRDNIDIIHTEDDDYVRFEKLREVSAQLCSDYTNKNLKLSNDLSSEIEKLSTALSNDVDKLSTDLSTEIEKLSTALSNTVKLSVEQLCSEISSNDVDISAVSSDLSILKYHYNRTFEEKFYTHGSTTPDISVDVLKIVNSENTDTQYTMQFLSGTLVLVRCNI